MRRQLGWLLGGTLLLVLLRNVIWMMYMIDESGDIDTARSDWLALPVHPSVSDIKHLVRRTFMRFQVF